MIRVKARAKSADEADVLIHEEIGADWLGDGLTSKKFAQDLAKLEGVKTLNVRINSPGGSVSDGVGIYNILRAHGAHIAVTVEGLAASIASIIAMAGDSIAMAEGALMMIHSPWTVAMGSAEDMRETADVLDKFEGSLLDIYQKRTGMDRKKLKSLLDAETWFDGAEAVENGFADQHVSVDAEASARLHTGYRDSFKAFASAFRRPADVTPLRIAAALIPSAPAEHQEITQMTEEEKLAAAAAQKQAIKDAADKAVIAAKAAEQDRRKQIRDAFTGFTQDHQALLDTCLDDSAKTVDAARAELLTAVAARQAGPLAGKASVGKDSRDKFMAGAEQGILARVGLAAKDPANEFRGHTIVDLARECLNRSGVSTTGMTKDQIARKILNTHSTSDFPLLFGNSATKALLKAYAEVPTTWDLWAKKGSVSDFKVNSRLALGSFSNLLTIPEGSEYKQGTFAEYGNNIQALTKGRYIELTRQMIVNDDLGAFVDRGTALGRAARRTVEADVYTSLTSASGLGPTMADGGTLFNATAVTTAGGHANYTSSGTALSVTSLNVGNQMIRAQKDGALNDFAGVRPKYLLVPAGKEYLAWELINSTSDPSQANPAKRNYVKDQLNLTVISSDYLTGNAWYLVAAGDVAPAYEVAFLDGNETPFIDEEVEFLTDAMRMKVRLDYGLAPIDFRAIYRNAGA